MVKSFDWNGIEEAYRDGIMPLREIGSVYGISDAMVRKKAGQKGWARDGRVCDSKNSKEGFVYLLSIVDTAGAKFYKIGMAKILQQRIDNIQGCTPFDLVVECAYFTNNRWTEERVLHKRFAHKNVRAEWFNLDDVDVAYIASRSLITGQNNG